MADGSQQGFNFPRKALASALRPDEIVLDFFAGGGGASEALRQALGRDPDVAVNHDHQAIGMHAANHPFARHMEADVWTVDILREVAGRPVGWFHASPDCTHFSQAKGGQPRSRATRSLSWVVVKVAGTLARHGLAPRIISLENVRQILGWCPLVAKRDKATGRVVKIDGSIAARGERVPLREQFLVPDRRRHGSTWSVPCPSIFTRKKALADATCRRIAKGVHRYVLGAIEPFIVENANAAARDTAEVQQPLARFRMDRRAPACHEAVRGTGIHQDQKRQGTRPGEVCGQSGSVRSGNRAAVATHAVSSAPFLTEHANGSNQRTMPATDPLRTQCAGVKGGHFALAAAHLVKFRGESKGADVQDPLPTITSGAGAARPAGAAHAMGMLTAFLEQAHGGGENGNPARARGADEPVSTISTTGSQQRLVTGTVVSFDEAMAEINAIGAGAPGPSDRSGLSPEHEAGAQRVAAFLMRYHGTGGQHAELSEPLTTVTTKDRLALVTVTIKGTPYVIVDIGLRMLRRQELYRAQGFPPDYIIDRTADGTPLSISASVRMVGNSVSPPPLAAIARANLDQVTTQEAIAA